MVTANPKVKRSALDCELQKQHNNANHSPVTTTKQGLIISHNLGILFRAFSESIELSKERERETGDVPAGVDDGGDAGEGAV